MHTSSEPPAYQSMASAPSTPAKKHDKYYYDDGNLVIRTSDAILFRLWDEKPSSDENPLVLEDVSSADFERLLWVLFPPILGQCQANSFPDWSAILSLATKFGVSDVRDLAIKELGKLPLEPVDKISLQQTYTIDKKWAADAFVALCTRAPALEVDEGKKLGIEMTVQVAAAREKLDKWGRKKPEEVKKVVTEVWGVAVEST
ncbi:hypothetical protein HMN09_00184500 [Mycena chlorophos]|uniref:BTB domain-containing protein n=1 Tax=Mycena chlorophos TaxID=658473 RepID=A0A8H6TQG9_MYCCL|nr:hypothetical protein HMN09_00184500 [Mycena chlorophos]